MSKINPVPVSKFAIVLKWFKRFAFLALLGIFVFILLNALVRYSTKSYVFADVNKIPKCYTALVLGARVYHNGQPSGILRDRLDNALELYQQGKVQRFLLSGDHGRVEYDEVNNMKRHLERKGVPSKDIFLDHAGFDTYDSMVRAKEVFAVTDVIIVTQAFHLPRAIFIARQKGLNAYGYIADEARYPSLRILQARESFAVIKAIKDVALNAAPKYLGDVIPITGDSSKSYD